MKQRIPEGAISRPRQRSCPLSEEFWSLVVIMAS